MEKQVNRPKIKKGNILVYLVLILGSVLMIFPFIWMISTSFKTVPETTLIPPTLLPASFSNTAAYEQVTKSLPFFNLYFTANALLQSNNKRIFHISPERTPPYCGPVFLFRVPEPGLNRRNRTSAGETGPRGQRTSFFCYACLRLF